MGQFKIPHKLTGAILFEGEYDSQTKCAEAAIRAKIDLSHANLSHANFFEADLSHANFSHADLSYANLSKADLSETDLSETDLFHAHFFAAKLSHANLSKANLSKAYLFKANLSEADLSHADLSHANLYHAKLSHANLSKANLSKAYLFKANLSEANLSEANLFETEGMIKVIDVEPGNVYWKRFDKDFKNNEYQCFVGLNVLREGEKFVEDPRVLYSYPGFHFASRSRCEMIYPDLPYEAKIRIPEDAKINEPWATIGQASSDKIEILQVFDTKTGEDVTNKFIRQ